MQDGMGLWRRRSRCLGSGDDGRGILMQDRRYSQAKPYEATRIATIATAILSCKTHSLMQDGMGSWKTVWSN